MPERRTIRTLVRGAYDLQKLRIMSGNRLVNNFRAKLGQLPGEKEGEIDEEGQNLLKALRAAFEKITDGVVDSLPSRKKFVGNEILSDHTELVLVAEYLKLEEAEAEHFGRLKGALQDFPIYTEYLKNVRGIGPAIAGVIISELEPFDITHEDGTTEKKYASSFWKYAGLDVAPDGAGRSRRKEHLVEREYIDKNGNPATRMSITFNPFLKTKLMGVLGPSLLRSGNEKYRKVYDDYKHRLMHHVKYGTHNDGAKAPGPDGKERIITSKLRRHNMAMRYMVKRFLVDLYINWRKLEGLEAYDEYAVAKLGLKHSA